MRRALAVCATLGSFAVPCAAPATAQAPQTAQTAHVAETARAALQTELRAGNSAVPHLNAALEAPRLSPVMRSLASEFAPKAPSPWRPLRIAKWSVTGISAGTALYGFLQNRQADDAYHVLEEMCQGDFARCRERLPGGAYADAQLESQYQHVRALDQRARTALVLGQIGVATSVVLFLIDLRNQQPPPNIPYEPNRLEIGASADGGLLLKVTLPAR
jgi:hypothetical protein